MQSPILISLLIALFSSLCLAKQRTVSLSYHEGYIDLMLSIMEPVKQAFEAADVKVEFVAVPGERGMLMMTTKKSQGELARAQEIEDLVKDNYFRISTSPVTWELGYLYRDDRFKNFAALDRKNARVGYIRGARLAESKAKPFQKLLVSKNQETLEKMLQAERLDLYLTLLSQQQKRTLLEEGYKFNVLEKVQMYTYLRKDFLDIQPQIEKAFREKFHQTSSGISL